MLPPVAVTGPASLTGIAAAVALLSLFAAPFLPPGRPALTAALDVFLGCCILSWWAARDQALAPPFAIFGSFGWLAYTFALGSLSTPGDVETEASPGPHLDPRTPPSRLSAATLLTILVCCLIVLGAAWRVERPAVSVLAHVFALATVLILLRSGALLATYLQVRGTKLASPPRLKRAIWPLLALSVVGAVSLSWFFLVP